MLNFDDDVDSVEDFLADMEDEPELTDKKWRFKERVTRLMNSHNLLRDDAEEVVETVIRTKETTKRCTCGEVAQYFDKQDKRRIYCGKCWETKIKATR
jgi:ribosomal protein S27AE